MDRREAFRSMAAQVTQGELAFPTSARVALKVRQALDDPDCPMDVAARLVQAEPLLAARVVAIANSVVYNRSGREITDVRTAVARMGFRTVRSLAMALVTRQMAGNVGDQRHQDLVTQLWDHTAHVASLAHVIARRITHQDPETAMFAGIVHEVGGFYMLSRADEFPGLLDDFSDWIEEGEIEVGRAVLKVLGVPEAVSVAIESYWDGFLAIPSTTLADTLLLAEELAPVPSPLHALGGGDNQHAGGSGMTASLDMAIGSETLTAILEESAEEVRSLTGALKF